MIYALPPFLLIQFSCIIPTLLKTACCDLLFLPTPTPNRSHRWIPSSPPHPFTSAPFPEKSIATTAREASWQSSLSLLSHKSKPQDAVLRQNTWWGFSFIHDPISGGLGKSRKHTQFSSPLWTLLTLSLAHPMPKCQLRMPTKHSTQNPQWLRLLRFQKHSLWGNPKPPHHLGHYENTKSKKNRNRGRK